MSCHHIGGAIVCTYDKLVDMTPYGAKVWMEWHNYLGPTFYRSKSCIKIIEKPSTKTWCAFNKWQLANNI